MLILLLFDTLSSKSGTLNLTSRYVFGVTMVMTEEAILQTLEENCPETGIFFQVFLQVPYLYIYINREADGHIDYIQLMGKIFTAIAVLQIPDIQGISLHSRIYGTVEPDWETYLELPAHFSQPSDHVFEPENYHDVLDEPEAEYDQFPVTESEVNPSLVEEVEPVSSDATKQEEPLENDLSPEPETGVEEDESPPEPITTETESPQPFELSKCCFTRNQGLLTAKLPHPSANVAKVVDFFHVLPNKQIVTPLLNELFNASKTPDTSEYPESIQQWIQEILELDSEKKRKASIWFSRYCLNPEATMEQVKAVLLPLAETPTPPKTEEKNPKKREEEEEKREEEEEKREPSLLTAPKYNPPATKEPTKPTASSRLKKNATRKKSPSLQPSSVHLAIAWIVFTIFAVMINFRSLSIALETSPLCENSPSPDQCELAVKMVGAPAIELATKSHSGTPSERTKAAAEYEGETADVYTTPYGLAESADNTCAFYGTIKAGMSFQEVTKMMPKPVSVEGSIILPGVYFVDVQQHNFKGGSEPVRTACVFRYQEQQQKVDIATLGIEVIPTKWPEEEFQETSQPIALQKASGVFGTLSVLGTGTLFTAVGMFIASVLGLGMRASSLEAIFKASFFLGIIETLLSFIPLLFLAKVAMETLALTLTSAVVKDFKVEWSMGYHVVALGAIVIMSLRTLLNWIVFGLLFAFLS